MTEATHPREIARLRANGPGPGPGLRRPWDALGLALATLYAVPAWFYPHGNDQGLHWYIGQGILRGELPFANGVSGKPVGIFAVHALAGLLFGDHQWGIRVFETLTLLAIAALLPGLTRTPGEPRRDGEIGASAVLLFGVHYTFFDYWDITHPETWVGLCTVAAAVIALRDDRGVRRVASVGALCGAAFMFKYTAALIALPIAMFCGVRAMSDGRDRGASLLAALVLSAVHFLLGVALVFALCVLPFWLDDALAPMWEVLYTFTVRYVKQAPGVPYTSLWVRFIFGGYALVSTGALLGIGFSVHLRRRELRAVWQGALLLVLAVAALLTVWLQRRFFSYHFMVAVPWFAACMLYGLRALPKLHGGRLLAASVALAAAWFSLEPRWCCNRDMSYAEHWSRLAAYLRDDMSRSTYLRPFTGMNYLDHYRVHEHIGLEVRKLAQPGDQLCVRGFAPGVYQVSGLRCPSRHVIQMWPAGLPQWEDEFWKTVETRRPRFIVTFRDRPDELQRLRRLGYRGRRMPSIYMLMERPASRFPSP